MHIKEGVILDYYQGAYGPTIRIDVVASKDLQRIYELFIALTMDDKLEINLTNENCIRTMSIGKFILKSNSNYKEGSKKLIVLNPEEKKVDVLWEMAISDWKLRAALVEVFLNKLRPGHQYLTKEGFDDALVEFAFLERPENINY